MQAFTRHEVSQHNNANDCWIIIQNNVYDVTKWLRKHPGGSKILLYYAGMDATDQFIAFHPQQEIPRKYMKQFQIGTISDPVDPSTMIIEFREMRNELIQKGFFKPDYSFYVLYFLHILVLELLAWCIAYYYTESSVAWYAVIMLLAISQIQAGWLQHDFGHLSVFSSRKWNNAAHHVTISILKGASSAWWKVRHTRHHAKTNVLFKDPDVSNQPLFLFGPAMVRQKLGWVLTPLQTWYWWIIGPPMVTTFLFVFQNLQFMFQHGCYLDLFWVVVFFVRIFGAYVPLYGLWDVLKLYFSFRLIESLWFTWTTSMSHLPMSIECDQQLDWVNQHLSTTQNVTGNFFNDWWSGHLNYQVEHHLFPSMPRHNYRQVHEQYVKPFCARHGLVLHVRPLLGAYWDVVRALRYTVQLYKGQKLGTKQLSTLQSPSTVS